MISLYQFTSKVKEMMPLLHRMFFLCALSVLCLYSTTAFSAQLEKVRLMQAVDGEKVYVYFDESVPYQVFDLSAPRRVVFNFPEIGMNSSIKPIQSSSSSLRVSPVLSSQGVRMELELLKGVEYKVEEQKNLIIIHLNKTIRDVKLEGRQTILQSLEVIERGDVSELHLRGFNLDINHNAYISNKGQRMVLDLWGAKSRLVKHNYQYSFEHIRDISVGKEESRVRIVVGLKGGESLKYQVDAQKNELIVRFGQVHTSVREGMIQVEGVDFKADDRIARLFIRTNSDHPVVNLEKKDDMVLIDIQNAQPKQGQERSMDVRSFSGPVSQVDVYQKEQDVRIIARLRGKVTSSSFQQGNLLTITLEPEDLTSSRGGGSGNDTLAYVGQKVTFDFKDIEIANALLFISEMANMNIIMSDDVKGTLTMHLVDVPWDQALSLMLNAHGLAKIQEGNVIRIVSVDVLQKENESRLKAQQGSAQLAPLVTEFVPLSYAKANDVKTMLEDATKQVQKKAGGESGNANSGVKLLSARGSLLADPRTNTLIIQDTQASILNIKRMIASIDTPVEQVLIEARIVDASDQFQDSVGIRWGGSLNRKTNYDFPGAISLGPVATTAANNAAIIGGGVATATGRGFMVDLPAAAGAGTGGAIGLSLGSFSNIFNLDLEISAAETDGLAKRISNPRIVTANGVSATISQGVDVPFITPGSANGPPTVSFKSASLGLTVTPMITAEDSIVMDVSLSNNAPTGDVVLGNPVIGTKNIQTKIKVNNGETVVIGGIFTQIKSNSGGGVPGLSRIPILGWLFKNKTSVDSKTELLIFLTPRIVDSSLQ
ncbi:MAG: type IV pilus secretin PilQ [Mariprofundaceae bacterium]|nr:type IV pilus secretin PilQ [Mariprofundaceae bacterium]